MYFSGFPIMIIEAIGSTNIFLSNPYFVKLGLIGLFINSLLSSVIPIPTELTICGLLLEGQSKIAIFIILISGSILGGFIAYYIGYGGIGFLKRLRKKPSKKSEDRSTSLLKKYGWTILFISPWIPIIGDYIPHLAFGGISCFIDNQTPLTFVAIILSKI